MKPTANDRRRPILHRGSDRRRREARNVKAEDLYRLRQITGCDVSPDGKHVAYTLRRVDPETEKKRMSGSQRPMGRRSDSSRSVINRMRRPGGRPMANGSLFCRIETTRTVPTCM